MSAAPYVTLDRPGLVYEVCPYCLGLGRSSYFIGDRERDCVCASCAGKGYLIREAHPCKA